MEIDMLFYLIALFAVGVAVGITMNEDEFNTDYCPEIDELCEEDFLSLCELTMPELSQYQELETYIDYLECTGDINGDTWRESDCGIEIGEIEKELGTCDNEYEEYKKAKENR